MEATRHIKSSCNPPTAVCGAQSWVLLTETPSEPATCRLCLEMAPPEMSPADTYADHMGRAELSDSFHVFHVQSKLDDHDHKCDECGHQVTILVQFGNQFVCVPCVGVPSQ